MQNQPDVQEANLSLIDAWIILGKYRKQFFIAFLITLILGGVYIVFIYKPTYSLITTIQIGTMEKDQTIMPIESPESLLSKINNSILPVYSNDWVVRNNYRAPIETSSSNPSKTNIILIMNKANDANVQKIHDFQKGLVSIIKDDHKNIIKSLKSGVLSELNFANIELERLKNPMSMEHQLKLVQMKLEEEEVKLKKLEDDRFFGIKKNESKNEILQQQHEFKRLDDSEKRLFSQIDRINENKKILLENINGIKSLISDATKNRNTADAGATEVSAMSQMLIDNEIQQNQNRLISLEERYYVTLENEKENLRQKIEDIRLMKIESNKKLELLNEKYNRLIAENKFMQDHQKAKVEEVKIELEQIKFQNSNAINKQQEKVNEIKSRIDNFNETRIVSAAIKSLKRHSPTRFQLMLLVTALASILGFLMMLVALFRDKVDERLEELASS